MFYYIEGKLAHLDYGFAVIDANGVGYKLTITQNTYEAMPPHLSAAYGHMGREDLQAPWEARDMADTLKAAVLG